MTEPEIADQASAFERERAARAEAAQKERDQKARRVWRVLWFLFAFMFFCFIVLAYRTETNNSALQDQAAATDARFYQACLDRRDRQLAVNVGREEFVQLIIARRVPAPADGERDTMIEQLRAALLVPVEECGVPPLPGD